MWVGEKTWMSIEKGSSDPPGIVSRLSAMGTEGSLSVPIEFDNKCLLNSRIRCSYGPLAQW